MKQLRKRDMDSDWMTVPVLSLKQVKVGILVSFVSI